MAPGRLSRDVRRNCRVAIHFSMRQTGRGCSSVDDFIKDPLPSFQNPNIQQKALHQQILMTDDRFLILGLLLAQKWAKPQIPVVSAHNRIRIAPCVVLLRSSFPRSATCSTRIHPPSYTATPHGEEPFHLLNSSCTHTMLQRYCMLRLCLPAPFAHHYRRPTTNHTQGTP